MAHDVGGISHIRCQPLPRKNHGFLQRETKQETLDKHMKQGGGLLIGFRFRDPKISMADEIMIPIELGQSKRNESIF